jgi:23S rRNA (guanosine2251-2'-O)-methyltransferase
VHPVTEALRERPGALDRVYFLQGRQSGALFALLKECRRVRVPYQVVPAMRLDRLAPGASHQGVVAVCAVKPYAEFAGVLERLRGSGGAGLVLVAASVTDPRNLGALLRSAVAFGVDAVLVERSNTAPLSEAVAKSAAGMLEHAVVARPRSLEAAIGELKTLGFRVIGADIRGAAAPWDTDLTLPSVLVLGGEHRGIPPYLDKLCDERVGIPLDRRAESLNVSAAASVLLYECSRQRQAAGR